MAHLYMPSRLDQRGLASPAGYPKRRVRRVIELAQSLLRYMCGTKEGQHIMLRIFPFTAPARLAARVAEEGAFVVVLHSEEC